MPRRGISAKTTKNDAIGSRRKPDRVAGRPPTPTPDPRLEAAKTWSTTARNAARAAFEAAVSRGATRDEAIDAGHEAGLRQNLEERTSSAGAGLAIEAAKIFGSSKVVFVPAGRPRSAREERCFDELFSEHGFPDFPEPETEPAQPVRIDSDDEDKKAAGEALIDGLAKTPPRQGTLAFDRRTA